jgi:hypothetical protein
MATLTATTDPTTGTIRIDVSQILARDQFTRVTASGWGIATTGQTWTVSGGAAADYSTNGTQGVMSLTSVGVSRNARLGSVATGSDMDLMGFTVIPVVPTGGPIESALGVRLTTSSFNNQYRALISIATTNVVTLRLEKVVLGVTTLIESIVLNQTHAAGARYGIRIAACGSTIMAKAWRNTVTEPDWLIVRSDFDISTGDSILARSALASGNTNALPVAIVFDDFSVGISQPIRIYRVTPDGVRTELRGSPFSTEQVTATSTSGQAVAWDGEAPFDTNVFYEMTSNCSSIVEATSNTVNLASGGVGWLRDPVDPTRNFTIELAAYFDECVDEDTIVFSGLGNPTYDSASGVFDIIDSRRPTTISQTRKNYASSLTLTSFSLDDILTLEDIFDPGRILMLSLPTSYGWALRSYGSDYITVGDVQQSYLGVDQGVTCRVWGIPFRLSYAPVDTSEGGTGGNGIGGGDATYDALAASALGLTYNSLIASGETYFQVAQGVGY